MSRTELMVCKVVNFLFTLFMASEGWITYQLNQTCHVPEIIAYVGFVIFLSLYPLQSVSFKYNTVRQRPNDKPVQYLRHKAGHDQ